VCCFGEVGLGGGELVEEVDIFAADFVGPEQGRGGWVPGAGCWCVVHGYGLGCLVEELIRWSVRDVTVRWLEWVELR